MHHSSFFALALLATPIIAIPLNINLGAYSPALVVGDGEISFGGKQDVSNLMNALEGAAVAGGAAAAAAPSAAAPATAAPATAAPAAAAVVPAGGAGGAATIVQSSTPNDGTQITSLQGMGKEIAPRVVKLVKSRDIAGFNAALNFATAALKTSPEVQLGTGEGGSGVGITQKAGGAAPAKAAAKRDEILLPKMMTTVTTMFIRGGAAPGKAFLSKLILD